MISYVWAEDQKHQIGYQGHLPWHLPADLKHFKEETMGHPILMGRNTFDSLPKILPGRIHAVLTHDEALKQKYRDNPQVVILNNQAELNNFLEKYRDTEVCAIGGVSIFKILLNKVDYLKKTEIDASFKADTVMPKIDYSLFKLINKEKHLADEKNKYSYSFLTYVRKDENDE